MTDSTQAQPREIEEEAWQVADAARAATSRQAPSTVGADDADAADVADAAGVALHGARDAAEIPARPRVTAADVEEALRDVIDPELGINVVDLGLVYGVQLLDDGSALVDMTLTTAACPLTDVIEQQAAAVAADLVPSLTINWVWMPPWGPDRITDDGREQLRAIGFNV